MHRQLNLVLSNREHKALSDVLHHERDCTKWFLEDMDEDDKNFEEYTARLAVLEYAVSEIDS